MARLPPGRPARHPLTFCPHCGHALQAATAIQGRAAQPPAPGDFTICASCAGVLQIDPQGVPAMPGFGQYEALRWSDPARWAAFEAARERVRATNRQIPPPAEPGGKA